MKVGIFQLGIWLLITFACISCKKERQSDLANEVSYDSISAAKIFHLENDSTKPSCSLKINYVYPVNYSDTAILAKIQQELNYLLLEDESYESLKPSDAVDKYITDYIDNYKREAKEQFPYWRDSDETEDYFSFYKTLNSRVLFDKGALISYQVSSMDYKGGANSSTLYRNIVIDLKTGNTLNEKDIFVEDYKPFLNQLLVRKIEEKNKVRKLNDLLELGYIGIDDLTSNNNFYVDIKGITYIFNPSEVAAPSIGEVRVFLPYGEINQILKKDSPISSLAGV